MEHDIQHPMQAIFDVPVASYGMGEELGVERHGGQVIPPFQDCATVPLHFGFDNRDGAQTWEARLAGEAARRDQPVHVVADHMAAKLNASVAAVCGLKPVMDQGGFVVEVAPDLVVRAGLIALGGQKVIAATVEDGLGDPGLSAHGVDGDEHPGECQAFEQQRDSGDLVRLGPARLLAQADTMWSGPRSRRWSWLRREVLPSMATISGTATWVDAGSRRVSTHAVKHCPKSELWETWGDSGLKLTAEMKPRGLSAPYKMSSISLILSRSSKPCGPLQRWHSDLSNGTFCLDRQTKHTASGPERPARLMETDAMTMAHMHLPEPAPLAA